jgi:hypothetical protein
MDEMHLCFTPADATPGVIYNVCFHYDENDYEYTQLWVSFDYGKNWILREENSANHIDYYISNIKGLIYRTADAGIQKGTYRSYNYAENFTLIDNKKISAWETGFEECEFFSLIGRGFYHTYDCYENYNNITIDQEYVFGSVPGVSPDVYRGGLPGEVYVSSGFFDPDMESHIIYKVSFSADTGHTFRHVYVSESYYRGDMPPRFMSDREPGVFYITRHYEIEDHNPWGWHTKVCIEYYRDYGETHVATYCHDLTKAYKPGNNIEELTMNNEQLTIYPNPTTGEFKIQNSKFKIQGVEVFDVMSRRQKAESRKQDAVDISGLHSGIYFVKITTEKGVVMRKVVKV